MLKNIFKRWLAITLSIVIIWQLLPQTAIPVEAADLNTGITGLSATSSGNGNWSISDGIITGEVTTEVSSGCGCSDDYSAQTSTLTFKNNTSFDGV